MHAERELELAPVTTEVAAGVYAYVQPDGGWCLSNAGIIHDGRRAAVVDTAATEARARLLRDQASRIAGSPPGIVVNTHFHGDHTFGNYLFAPAAAIIAQQQTRTDAELAGLHMRTLWPEVTWGDLELAPPTVLFQDRMTLYVGDTRVELVNAGPAHTASDTVAWLPEQRVLFTGDVVMSGVTPFCLMGSVPGSMAAIGRLRALHPAVVVPGHGPVGGPELLDQAEGYFRWLQDLAREGMAAGLEPLELARDAGLGDYADWLDHERLVANLYRAYADERGVPATVGVDVMVAFGEMTEYRGTRLLSRA